MQRGGIAGRQGRGGACRSSYVAATMMQGFGDGAPTTNLAQVLHHSHGEISQMKGDAQEEVDMDVEVVNIGGGDLVGSKVGGKPKVCNRYSLKGLATMDFTNEVYCYICDGHDHVNHRCPVLKIPKLLAHAVRYLVAALGFFHIPHALLPRKNGSKNAPVIIVGGPISREQHA